MPKVLAELEPYENIMLAVAAVALVWLLLRHLNVKVDVSRQGFNVQANYLNMLDTNGGTKYTPSRV